jgi:hypothetical protein
MKLFHTFLIFLVPALVFSQSIRLKGKVIDENKKPVSNLAIRFTTHGDVVTTGSGEFIITVPQSVQYVDAVVRDEGWQLLYPVDAKIPVPSDPNFITTIIVSGISSTEGMSMEESILKYNELENLLKDIGTKSTELGAFLEKFIGLEARKLEISESLFREEFERKERRETTFSRISRILNEYLLRLGNLKTNFEMNYEIAFVSNPAVENLNTAIKAYNPVFDTIYNNSNNWEAVIKMAKDTVLSDNFAASVNYMIDEVHTPYIFQLNESIKELNKIRLRIESNSGDFEERKKEEVDNVSQIMKNLETEIPILKNRFNELLINLHHQS